MERSTGETSESSLEFARAEEALRLLRAEKKRTQCRPYRAATLAEAEAIATAFDDGRTPRAVMREQGLTCKAQARVSAYSPVHGPK